MLYRVNYLKVLSLLLVMPLSLYVQPQPLPMPTEEELKQIQQLVEEIEKNDPELYKQLQEEGRKILREQGIDPDTLEPISHDVPELQPDRTQERSEEAPSSSDKPEIQEKPQQQVAQVRGQSELKEILAGLSHALKGVRLKAQVNHSLARVLERFKKELDDLLYFLPVLQQQHILKHLGTEEFTELYRLLKSFSKNAIMLEIKLTVEDVYNQEQESPYQVLGLRPGSSIELIKNTFNKRMDELDPKKLKANKSYEQMTKAQQELVLNTNELQRISLQEAFEALSNAKTKKRLDAEHELSLEQGFNSSISKELLRELSQLLTEYFYQDNILATIKNVLNKYEPEAVQKRESMELALKSEEERKSTAKKRTQGVSPRTVSKGGVYYQQPSSHYGGGYSSPYSSYDYQSPSYNSSSGMQPGATSDKSSGGGQSKASPGQKGAGEKKKDKEDDKNKKPEFSAAQDKEKKKDKDGGEKAKKKIVGGIEALLKNLQELDSLLAHEADIEEVAKKLISLQETAGKISSSIDSAKDDDAFDKKLSRELAELWQKKFIERAFNSLNKLKNIAMIISKDEEPDKDELDLVTALNALKEALKKISKELGLIPKSGVLINNTAKPVLQLLLEPMPMSKKKSEKPVEKEVKAEETQGETGDKATQTEPESEDNKELEAGQQDQETQSTQD